MMNLSVRSFYGMGKNCGFPIKGMGTVHMTVKMKKLMHYTIIGGRFFCISMELVRYKL